MAQQMGTRSNKAIVGMLASACEHAHDDPELVASMLWVARAAVSRRILESGAAEEQLDTLNKELILCSVRLMWMLVPRVSDFAAFSDLRSNILAHHGRREPCEPWI